MNIKGYRIISEKNVFRRIAALLTTLLLVITAIPEGFSTAITSVAEAADTAVTGAYFDTDGMEIVTYNVVNDFGADNTGNAMTEKQIQQALDAAQENSGQGIFTKVVIPKGTYLISSALVVYSDTWIYCEEGVEIKRCISYGPMLRCDNNGVGGYDGVKNVIVEGGLWNGNTDQWPNTADFSNIRFAHCRNILLKDMHVKNNENGHHMEIGGAADVTIEGCTFTGYTGYRKKEAIQLDCMNNSRVFAGYAPFDDTSCENVVIKNNLFSGICRGLGSHSATLGIYYTDILIEDNVFENLDDMAMIMYNYKNCTITNNTITNCASGIEFKAMSSLPNNNFNPPVVKSMEEAVDGFDDDANSVISSNTISVSGDDEYGITSGIRLTGYEVKDNGVIPDYNFRVAGVKIVENRIESNGTTIALNDAENCSIESNILVTKQDGFNYKDKNGLTLNECDNIKITDNYISGSARNGASLTDSSGNTLENNTIENVGMNGINIYNGSENNIASSNSVNSAKKHGIAVAANSSAVIKSNSISKAGDTGILIYNGSKGECSGNKVKNAVGHGIVFSKNASGKATSNTVSGAGKHGVLVTDHCGSVALSSNKISNSKQNGVCVSNYSSFVSVNSNSISGSGKSGISVSSHSKASLKDNAVNGSKSAAVSKSADSSISLPRVSGLSVNSVNNTDIQISFSGRSTNKCGYEIYRKTGAKGKYSAVGTTAKGKFTDGFFKANTDYYYKVRCYETVSGKRVYGRYSDEIKVRSATKRSVGKASVKVSDQVWTGKALKPAVTVKDGNVTLKKDRDYTVSYSANKGIGTAKVTVTGKGSYTGKITKTFKINPQGQSVSAKGDKSGKKIAVTLAKHSSNSGYQVSYADNSGFKNSKSLWLSGNSKNKGTIKGLKSKKTYYVKARDYKTISKTKVYGKWSAVKKVSI